VSALADKAAEAFVRKLRYPDAQAANSTIYRARLCTAEFQLNAVELCCSPSGIRCQNVELDPVGFEREILESATFFGALNA